MTEIENILKDVRLTSMETKRVLNNSIIPIPKTETSLFNDILIKNLFTNNKAQVYHVTFPPLSKIDKHIHKDSTEIFYILKGSLVVGDAIYEKGETIIIEPGEEHNGSSGATLTEAIIIIAPPEKEYEKLFM